MTENHHIEIITRKQAIERGLKRFFNGKPCPKGHMAWRTTKKSSCVQCQKEYVGKDKDKWKIYNREWRKDNKDHIVAYDKRECKKEQNKIWKKSNPDKVKKYKRTGYFRNIDKCRSRKKSWERLNKDKVKSHRTNMKAKRRMAVGKHSATDLRFIMNEQNNTCTGCYSPIDFYPIGDQLKAHVDHIMPIALGGTNWPWNIQMLCSLCNLRKGSHHPDEWERIKSLVKKDNLDKIINKG